MSRAFGLAVLWVAILGRISSGQALMDEVSFKTAQLGGLHLYGVSVYSGYSSSAYPQAGLSSIGALGTPGLGDLGPDYSYGATATVGWQHHSGRTEFGFMYTGNYSGMARYTALNSFNHTASVNLSRQLGRRWKVSLNGFGDYTTLPQYLFEPTSLGVLSQMPVSFDDLAAALSVGQFTNTGQASMLTSPGGLESPAQALLLGDRFLTYSARVSLDYAHSSRLSFHFGSVSASGQQALGQNGLAQGANQKYIITHSLGGDAAMSINYQLSPRTDISGTLSESLQSISYQHAYVTNAMMGIGRKMGMHWFLRGSAGQAFTRADGQVLGIPSSRQYIGGGSLGYQTFGHTLVGSYNRSSTDAFGLATGTNTALSASWGWHRPGSRWNINTSFQQQLMRNTGFVSLSGWQASGGISENLSNSTKLTVQYVYLASTGTYLGRPGDIHVHSVRLSFGWTPQAR